MGGRGSPWIPQSYELLRFLNMFCRKIQNLKLPSTSALTIALHRQSHRRHATIIHFNCQRQLLQSPEELPEACEARMLRMLVCCAILMCFVCWSNWSKKNTHFLPTIQCYSSSKGKTFGYTGSGLPPFIGTACSWNATIERKTVKVNRAVGWS